MSVAGTEPALGIVELSSIARGVQVADAIVKRAPVRILQNHPISPGKHVVVVAGESPRSTSRCRPASRPRRSALVDRLFLPAAHE